MVEERRHLYAGLIRAPGRAVGVPCVASCPSRLGQLFVRRVACPGDLGYSPALNKETLMQRNAAGSALSDQGCGKCRRHGDGFHATGPVLPGRGNGFGIKQESPPG